VRTSFDRFSAIASVLYGRSRRRLAEGWRTTRGIPAVLRDNANRPAHRSGLVVLDDVFPLSLSGFRIAEFNAYLDAFPDAEVHSSGDRGSALGSKLPFATLVREHEFANPALRGRIKAFNPLRKLDRKALAYSVLANPTRRYLPILKRDAVPFVFTLYPGGGFYLDNPKSDAALRDIFGAKGFRKVIVTQTLTRDYLLTKELCDPSRIELIYGGVFRSNELTTRPRPRRHYGFDKPTLDLCFVAHKYMARGADKGYDRFIEAGKLLARQLGAMRLHVVGPFTREDVPIDGLEGRIAFHGSQPTEFFPDFYAGMDAIVSPNLPNLLLPGAFDGFPTGSCMEAGMCGVAVFCSDPLQLNYALQDGEDVVIIPAEPARIADILAAWAASPDRLKRLGDSAAPRFRDLFGIENQMAPRIALVSQLLAG
jgi:glycosyltransferase involved in cell wall biosynthesis